jgi:Na+:H+ antiporter, NhaA family
MSNSSNNNVVFLGFIPKEALPGALLLLTACLAMLVVNSPLGPAYETWLKTPISIGPTGAGIEMKLSAWIKNGLMAFFFFFVGLELKSELLEGQLASVKAASLPVLAAIGGMIVPALIYLLFAAPAGFSAGWAIPSATDIAFALGVLSLLGNRVPAALKAFLLAVAVVDDLGAIIIVAAFYTESVQLSYLLLAAAMTLILMVLNIFKMRAIGLYILLGSVLWVLMNQSGISATIAGVVVAACIPLHVPNGHSPLHQAEQSFRPYILYGVMPIFAFANAGVNLHGSSAYLQHPIAMGTALGLALGKPVGITMMTLAGARLMRSKKPGTLFQIAGVGCIAGVGFTMSLFVGALAFTDDALATPVRMGVYFGSIISAALGLVILARSLPRRVF